MTNPIKKFITLNHHCGYQHFDAQWVWDYIQRFYLDLFARKNFVRASLSVKLELPYIWRWGNREWDGDLDALEEGELERFTDFLRNGGGLVCYQFSGIPPTMYHELPKVPTFEDYINCACVRNTERFHPFSGAYEDPRLPIYPQGRAYGLDAAHEYIGKIGEGDYVRACINDSDAAIWIASKLCGCERGEFAGNTQWGPGSSIGRELEDNPLGNPNWMDDYVQNFAETPFLWRCGLLTLIPFKFYCPEEPYGAYSVGMNVIPIVDDISQRVWGFKTLKERLEFILDFMNDDSSSPVFDKRVAMYIMSKDCNFVRGLSGNNNRRFNIPGNSLPYPPSDLIEARQVDAMKGVDTKGYGKWKVLYEEMLDHLISYAASNSNIILMSDQKASKDIVVPQYDGSVSLDANRIYLIADYLANIGTNTPWQIDLLEFQDPNCSTNRPPDFVKIRVNDEWEYYSLAEAWWYLLAALWDIYNSQGIGTRTLAPVCGPYEPLEAERTRENVYRVQEWAQHDDFAQHIIPWANLMDMIPGLWANNLTDWVGPRYSPDGYPASRKVQLPKVIGYWKFFDSAGIRIKTNSAEMLYIFAKAVKDWVDTSGSPGPITFFPSHVLPKQFYSYMLCGYKPLEVMGPNCLGDIGQIWTIKPAVLKPSYR